MLAKDTFRLIKTTANRFLSLLLIVLIGTAFMMGLLSTRSIMETSVSDYDRDLRLHDVQVYSAYGFDEADVEAIRAQEQVTEVFASRFTDVLSEVPDGTTAVTRVEECERTLDHFDLVEGRLPEMATELLILEGTFSASHYPVGGTIKLFLEDSDIGESLANDEFTIVGIVRSPNYLSKTLGTGLLKNLELQNVVFIPASNFKQEYYTTVYAQVEGLQDPERFSDEYGKILGDALGSLETFAARQQEQLKGRLADEYRSKIEEGEREMEEKLAEGQAKLDEAKAQLDDANVRIVAGETQLTSLQAALAEAQARQQALERRVREQSSASLTRIAQIEAEDPEGRSFETIFTQLSADYGTYMALQSLLSEDASQAASQGEQEMEARRQAAAARQASLEAEKAQLEAVITSDTAPAEEKDAAQTRLTALETELVEARVETGVAEQLLASWRELSGQTEAATRERMEQIDAAYGGSVADAFSEYTRLQQDRLLDRALSEEVQLVRSAVDRIRGELAAAQQQLDQGRKDYESGQEEYRKAALEFELETDKARSEIRKAYQDLEDLPEAHWTLLGRDQHYASYMYLNNAKQMGAIGIALPILFYLVAALVCMTTMTRLVDEQRGQIGTLRALGFSRGQVVMKYVTYAVTASLIGSTVGIFAGMAIFPTVIYNTWRLMYQLPPMHMYFPVRNVLICFLAFSALIALVTWIVVRRTLAEMPSQLMRPKAPKKARRVFLENFPALWNRMGFTSKITARNLFRYKGRLIMTVIGVAGCTALLVVGWGIKDSIGDIVSIQYGQLFRYDYSISLEKDADTERFTQILKDDLENEAVSPLHTYASKVWLEEDDPTIQAVVIDARDAAEVFVFHDAADHKTELRLKNSGVIISEKFAKNHGLKAGDRITVESSGGLKAQVRIDAVCEMYFQHYLFISSELYESVFDEKVHCDTIAVRNPSGDGFVKAVEDRKGFESLTDFTSLIGQFNNMIRALDFIILVIILTAGSLSFVVLVNLSQVNISERVREIATLKVLGFRTGEVNSYIFREIMLLTVLGALCGLPLGVVEHRFIMNVINMEMIMFGMNIKPLTFVCAFGVTMVFALIVLLMMRRPLRRVEMIESLKSVE